MAVILETKRADFYAQFFGSHGGAPFAASAQAIANVIGDTGFICIGDALDRFRAAVPATAKIRPVAGFEAIDPVILAQLACEDVAQGRAAPPEPLYLRPPDVTAPKKAERILKS